LRLCEGQKPRVPIWPCIGGNRGSTYRLLSNTRWAIDKTGVYYKDQKVPNADPETFEALGRTYGRDRTTVFCGTLKMDVAEPKRFKETSSQDGMEGTSYAYGADDLVKKLGEDFRDAPFDRDHPAVWTDGTGTDGVFNYAGPSRTSPVN
jgi:hypothetical protein